MGGELGAAQSPAPVFFVIGQRDPQSAGLQKLQIVKGWSDGASAAETVHTVFESANRAGQNLICLLWSDPAFDPAQPAFYYARLFEVATPRWSTLDCQGAGVDCSDPHGVPPEFERCCNGDLPETIQERAWSSPIWYQP